jgi:heat shock protein HslJ
MTMHRLLPWILGCGVLLPGCASDLSTAKIETNLFSEEQLQNPPTWHLVKLLHPKTQTYNSQFVVTPTLIISPDRLSGNSGCNGYFAAYAQQDKQLKIDAIAGTRKLCPESIMQMEHDYLSRLAQVTQVKLRHDQLELLNTQQQSILFFSKTSTE